MGIFAKIGIIALAGPKEVTLSEFHCVQSFGTDTKSTFILQKSQLKLFPFIKNADNCRPK